MPASAREIDPNGFLLVKGCPLSSFGIFDYSAAQLGLPGDPNRIVKVFRPESAVSDPEAINSFRNVPLINDHRMLSGFQNDPDATAPEDYGVDGVLTANVYYEAPWMRGDLKVFSREMQTLLQQGKKDLSLGYSCQFEVKPGVWNGQPYEVVQTNMRGNHIALVGEGRVPGARVLDGLCFDHLSFEVLTMESDMPKGRKAAMDNAVEQLKVLLPQLLPAFQAFLAETNEQGTQGAEGGAAPAAAAAPAEGAGGEAAAAAAPAAGAEGGATSEPEGDGGAEMNGEQGAAGGDPAAAAAPAGGEEGGGDPAAAAAPAGGAEGGAPAGGGDGVAALISNIEAVLAQLKAAVAGGGQGTDEDGNGQQPENAAGAEGAGTEDGVEGLEGLAQTADEGSEAGGLGAGQGHASPGPQAGQNATASDAAIRRFYADLDVKTRLYDRVSKVVGAFDHAVMDARQVGIYGVKKLGLKCEKGQEVSVLDAYLTGLEKANKVTKQRVQPKPAAQDAAPVESELDQYLKGAK